VDNKTFSKELENLRWGRYVYQQLYPTHLMAGL